MRYFFSCAIFLLAVVVPVRGEAPKERTDSFGDPLPAHAAARLGTVRFRAGAEVKAVAFTPDGKTVVVAGADNVIRLWDLQKRQEVGRLTGHERAITSLAFSPDGKLASAGLDRSVRLWDLAAGKEVRKITSDGIWVTTVAFSPDGRTLAAGTRGRHINLWDAETGKKLKTLKGHTSWVTAVVFSKDGKNLISAGRDKTIRFWDLASGKESRQRLRGRGMIYALVRSPDGAMLASGGADSEVSLWDPATAADLRKLAGHESSVHALTFSPDGKTLATGSRFGQVHLWDPKTGELRRIIRAAPGEIASLAFAPDGKTLAVADRSQLVRLWDPGTGKDIRPTNGHAAAVATLAFSPDGKQLLTSSKEGELYLWDVAAARKRLTLDAPSRPILLAGFSPDGRALATMNEDRQIALWDADKGTLQRTFQRGALALDFSPQGHIQGWIADSPRTAAQRFPHIEGGFQLLDLISGKPVHSFQTDLKTLQPRPAFRLPAPQLPAQVDGHLGTVTAIAVSHGRTLVASGSRDRTIVFWDVPRARFIGKLTGHETWITALAFSPDDRLLASAGPAPDGSLYLWETVSRRRIVRGPSVVGEVTAMHFSPDGRTLAWADGRAEVRRWDIVHGRELSPLPGHRDRVTALAFSRDGQRLASGSHDTTVLLWDYPALPFAFQADASDLKTPDRLWDALANEDANRAYEAIWELTAKPAQAVAFLRARMPVDGGKQKTIAERIAELDAKDFPTRQQATEALEGVGELARMELLQTLQAKPSLEVRIRIEKLLRFLDQRKGLLAPNDVRQVRAVQVLEWLNTAESRTFLEALSKGPPLLWQTREARLALERLKKH